MAKWPMVKLGRGGTAGRPSDAAGGSRGFMGIVCRLQHGQFEYIYLRPSVSSLSYRSVSSIQLVTDLSAMT